jgi:hypothetical protein
MRRRANVLWLSVLVAISAGVSSAQTASPNQRSFPQSKATIEKTLQAMPSVAGRLPALEGFAKPGEYPLDRYRHGYYQATFEVDPAPSGGSVVRVTITVTAWYADPSGSHSGYQLLTSNGRLEADLLDQLADQLAAIPPATAQQAPPSSAPPVESAAAPAKPAAEPAISAPSQQFPDTKQTFSSSLSHGLAAPESAKPQTPEQAAAEKAQNGLRAEVANLETMLKAISHPNNLVAVKKSGTPVVATPSLTAKTQFLASMHDEFELLDFNSDWVHVRISGLSRGWIWRNSVEMPEGIPDTGQRSVAAPTAADLFQVSREEKALFPGDWEPLRNQNVEIISVQRIDPGGKDAGPKERLEYAKLLLEKSYEEIRRNPQELQGVVVIFDSSDGGMMAATLATLEQWKAGKLSDGALWHQCFFDPPETFDSPAAAGSH